MLTGLMHEQLGRRRLVRNLAWVTPAIVVGAPAPSFAASPVPCPTMPPGNTWSTTYSGAPGATSSGGFGWNAEPPYNFNVYRDNGSTSDTLVFTTTTEVDLQAGVAYTLSTPIWWGYGNGQASQSTPLTVSLRIGATDLFSVPTRTAPLGTPGNSTLVRTYTATSSGPTTVRLRFSVSPRTQQANDDIRLTLPSFTRCVRG